MSAEYTEWLYLLAPFAIPAGVALGALHCWWRPFHARHCCPATVGPWVRPQPTRCSCKCRKCKAGEHEAAG